MAAPADLDVQRHVELDRRFRRSAHHPADHAGGFLLALERYGYRVVEATNGREGVEAVTSSHRVAEPTIPLFESGESDLATRAEVLLEGFGEQ